MTFVEANETMRKLLATTVEQEAAVATRDGEVGVVVEKYAAAIARRADEMEAHRVKLEAFYGAHPPAEGKSIQLTHGVIGVRTASTAALAPLNEKWTWAKIERKLKRLFQARYFHKPKPPGIDKVKLKRDLSLEQLANCGLKLETTETFYCEPNRQPASGGYCEAA